MARHQIGLLAVGINDDAYRTPWTDRPSIRFAQADAEAVHAYVVRAWPSVLPEHAVLLPGAAATTAALRDAASALTRQAEFDLVVLYLAGHGVARDAGAYFCSADGVPDRPGLGPGELDVILGALRADRVLVLVDCCHAHRITGACRFFGELGDAVARLYVCSSGGVERSWEDPHVGHGLFTAALLAALGTRAGNPSDTRGLQSDLVPGIRRWVATAAQERGGVAQQPVSGGTARDDVMLPLVSGSEGLWQPPTATRAVRRGVARVLRWTAVSGVSVGMLCQLSTYHVSTNRSGRLSVATGLPWLNALWPSGLTERVDLGLPRHAVRTEPAAVWDVSNGRQWGVWTHRDRHRLRSWFDRLVPLLGDRARNRALALVRAEVPSPADPAALSVPQPWQISDALDAAVLAASQPPPGLLELFPRAPEDFIDHDGEVFEWSSEAVGDFAAGAVTLTTLEPEEGARSLDRVRRAAAYRLARAGAPPNQSRMEVGAVASAYRRAAHRDQGRAVVDATLGALDSTFAADSVTAACCLAHAAADLSESERDAVAQTLLARLQLYNVESQGEALTIDQSLALDGLGALAAADRLTDAELQSVWDLGGTAAYERLPEVGEFLIRLAETRKLPDSLRAVLIQRVREPKGEYDVFASQAATALAANARLVDAPERDAIGRAVLAYGERFERGPTAITPGEADRIGRLGEAGVDVSSLEPLVRRGLDRNWIPPPDSSDYEVVATEVVWSDMPFAIGLARMHRAVTASDAVISLLRSVALLRPDAEGRDQLVKFLAAQRDLQTEPLTAARVRRALAQHPGNAPMRDLEVEIAVERAMHMGREKRNGFVDQLRHAWQQEGEPQVRWGLAEIILDISR